MIGAIETTMVHKAHSDTISSNSKSLTRVKISSTEASQMSESAEYPHYFE